MNEEEESIDLLFGQPHTTLCEHYYVETDSDPNSNLTSAVCTKCWNGINYDALEFTLIEGQLTRKKGA